VGKGLPTREKGRLELIRTLNKPQEKNRLPFWDSGKTYLEYDGKVCVRVIGIFVTRKNKCRSTGAPGMCP